MNQHIRDALRQAGAEAGRKTRADAGPPKQVEDHQAVQRMADAADQGGRSSCRRLKGTWGRPEKQKGHRRKTVLLQNCLLLMIISGTVLTRHPAHLRCTIREDMPEALS